MRSVLRFIAGAVVGGFLWFYATPAYDAFLGRAAAVLLRLDHRLSGTVAERDGENLRVRNPENLAFPTVTIPADQLTYNLILFIGLMAARPGTLRRSALAVLILVATHILAVTASIESTYATKLGAWSDAHYGGGQQDFWTATEYLYRLAGMFAIAFTVWWVSIGAPSLIQESPAKPSPPDRPRPA